MKFHFEDYINTSKTRYIMHCPDRESSILFSQRLDEANRKWGSGDRYTDLNYFDVSPTITDMYYYFNEGFYGSTPPAQYSIATFEILEFYDFDWGDVEEPKISITFSDFFNGA